ncbi:MAG: OsmC family protein, partial [Gaiellaceae bacterium]
MPRIERRAQVAWEGNVARGSGAITAATSGAFSELPFSLPTRIGQAEGKTSPEELLAGAHAGCLTMSLAGELTQAGTPPGRLDVTCTIVMDEVEGQGHQV